MSQPSGPSSQFYISQRLRLHYVDWGNEGAPPLLLIHGGRDHCRNWDWVAEALRDRYHVIAPDLRGHGDSQWLVGGTYEFNDYVYDIAQLIHQKKLAPLTIVAHSLGGSIALRYTALYPETVKKVVATVKPAAGAPKAAVAAKPVAAVKPAVKAKPAVESWSCPADGMVHPWPYKGKQYLRNSDNEVWLKGEDGSCGEWQGIFRPTEDRIDDSVAEPVFDDEE
jgi:pimeloyl-ACP methyl ester carboxylesterase